MSKYHESKQQYKEYNSEVDKRIKLIDNLNSIYNTKYTLKFFPYYNLKGELIPYEFEIAFYHDGIPFSLSNHDKEIVLDDFQNIDLHIETLSKIEDFIAKNKAKLFDLDMNCHNVHCSENMKTIQRLIEESK